MTEISRRGLAALAALPLMFSRLQAQSTLPAANDPNGHLTIPVEINGMGPFRFVVDTGADVSVLADTTVRALNLSPAGAVMLAGIVRTVQAETVAIDSLKFGPYLRSGLSLPILPRAQLRADGYLGLDMLDGNRVILDFAQHQLVVTEPMPLYASVYRRPDQIVLPAQGYDGHLRTAKCSVNNFPVAAFIDTGAESSMGNEALYRMLVDSDQSYTSTQSITLIGLTGGTATGRIIYPRKVSMGSLDLSGCPIAIADLQVFELWGLTERPALVIGMNWLRQFKRVEIDYGRKDLRFEVGRNGFSAAAV